jgi:hypothetical protein
MRAPRLPWRETCGVCNARPASASRSMTCGRLSVYNSPLERWPPDLQDVAPARRPCIPEAHPVVREGHLARQRHVAPVHQPRIGDGLVGRTTRAGGDQRRAVAREAGDAMDACRLHGFGHSPGWQDRGEPPRQHHRACVRGLSRRRLWTERLQNTLLDQCPLGCRWAHC